VHTVEEASRLLRLLVAAELRLQFFDTRIGALERLVLDEGCLHQRVGGLRRASQAVRDHALGSRVARAVLQFGQAIKQFRTQRSAPLIRGRRRCPTCRLPCLTQEAEVTSVWNSAFGFLFDTHRRLSRKWLRQLEP
jgi:hypothetical protein